MSYIQQTLGSKEKILYRTRFHTLFWLIGWISLTAFLGLTIYWLTHLEQSFWRQSGLVILIAFSLYYAIKTLLPLWMTRIALTNHRIVMKRGWIARSIEEMQLTSIEEVSFTETLPGRIFGYGTIIINGTGVNVMKVDMIDKPTKFLKKIQDASPDNMEAHTTT